MTNLQRLQANNASLRLAIDKANNLPNVGSTGSDAAGAAAISLIRRNTGYIDTGIDGANSNLTIEIRYEFIKLPTNGYWNIIYAYASESVNATRILQYNNSSTYACLNSVPTSSLVKSITRYPGVVYTDILSPASSTMFSYTTDGAKTNKSRTDGDALIGETLKLFHTSAEDGVEIKVYYLKIYDGETIVRDYVPRVTKRGECGLYDKVSNEFFGTAEIGAFEAETIDGIIDTEAELYAGTYMVTPAADTSVILDTENKLLSEDITVNEIPFEEAQNNMGGSTVTIA